MPFLVERQNLSHSNSVVWRKKDLSVLSHMHTSKLLL